MTRNIETVLFDFDGTLLDTNALIIATFRHVLDEHFPGQYEEDEQILPFLGPSLSETFTTLAPEKSEQLIAQYRAWNIAHHDEYAKPFPGVQQMLHALQQRNIPFGIVSTKTEQVIRQGIRLLEVEPSLFQTLVAIDHVDRVKPDPQPILLAMEQMNARPETTIIVGDNSHDIEGGQRAGIRTMAVSWSAKGEDFLRQFNPTYVAKTMEDIVRIIDEENR